MTRVGRLDGPIGSALPEMPRPFAIARIGNGARFDVEASPEELVALARRMGIPSISALTCRFDLRRTEGDAVAARGMLRARISQICVVTLEPFESDLAEDFSVRFVPAGTETEVIDLEADDEIGYDGGVLDLGEATSEQLALALDPFPRRPGVEVPDDHADRQAGAFAALSRLRPAPPHPDDTSEE